ncbi:hypothetical protein ACH4U6_34875 [Streptomyces netropsis]|uniref:hypothetical protein n=1 Tax=Streptomyces netropsis TaxID=55404 RepID=UPI0037B0E785
MDKIPLTLRTMEGTLIATIEAQLTTTPGLVIHRALDSPLWRLAHHSGQGIAEFESDHHAALAAQYLGALGDWTRSPEAILAHSPTLLQDVGVLVADAEGVLLVNPEETPTTNGETHGLAP